MILFIAQEYNAYFGGGVITNRNLTICKDVLGHNNLSTYLLPSKVSGGIKTLKAFITGYLMELSADHEIKILKILADSTDIKYVFIDSSMLGRLSKAIKTQFPHIHVIVFFHNIEYLFFLNFLSVTKRYWHGIGLWSIYKNEKLAIEYSDSIISLNSRDSNNIKKKYHRSADLILPTSLQDKFNKDLLEPVSPDKPLSLLFVGSRFYPNEQGLSWFIKEVMPYVNNARLTIIGKGFEELKEQWNSSNINVIGACSDMAPYYYHADIVIAPIFSGSGMKTKTAEALMYGKTIVASTEAFEGYDIDKSLVGGEFNLSSEYINYINSFRYSGTHKFNPTSREYFERKYSFNSSIKILKKFISNVPD